MSLKEKFTKRNILLVVVVIWIIFSTGYVVQDQWKKYEGKRLQSAYQQGMTDSIRALMKESETCQPIPVFDGDNKTQFISIACLEAVADNQEEEAIN